MSTIATSNGKTGAMVPFKVAIALAIFLTGAAAAHATTVTVVLPTTFGGFETAGETGSPGQWSPSPGFTAATLAIASATPYAGTYAGDVTTTSSSAYQFVGLQDLSVIAGDVVTVSTFVKANSSSDYIELLYATTGTVSSSFTLANPLGANPYRFTSGNAGTYFRLSWTFTAPSNNIDIDFGFLNAETVTPMLIDYVTVSYVTTASVPEPASMALLGVGLLGLGLVVRRRKTA